MGWERAKRVHNWRSETKENKSAPGDFLHPLTLSSRERKSSEGSEECSRYIPLQNRNSVGIFNFALTT